MSNLESSKLNKTLRTGSGQDLNAIIPSSGSIEVYRVFNPSANVPPGYTENSCDFFLIAICEAAQLYVRQYAFDVRSTAIWTRRSYDDSGVIHWQDWKQIVLATPPQEFDLPLVDGWTTQQPSTYFKTQEGIVVARIAIKSTAEYTSGSRLFTLPEGFRPSENAEFPCTIKKANLQASSIYLQTSGAASENHSGGESFPIGTELCALAIFIAAS